MHRKNIVTTGKKIEETGRALIMIHGRGSSAENILSLATHLNVNDYTLIAPRATNNTWYPYSFLETPSRNEPWLSSALAILGEIVNDLTKVISKKNIYFLGFSQGACLVLEFVARNAAKYGGCVAFTGGLIGDKIYTENYEGDFQNTPVFIGTSNPDPHVPVERVYETVLILKSMNASVTEKIYENIGHTIIQDEFDCANELILKEKNDISI
ncbi:MAG: alpha/beta hydrolase [Chitinophagales bacterium]